MKIFLSVIGTIIVIIIIGLIIIYSGWIDVSASNPSSGLTKWVLVTTMESSVESRANEIEVPDLTKFSIEEGAEHYKEMCEICHGGPGVPESELSKGLDPPAPYLKRSVKGMQTNELFWITKYGIKMTGMPAWGKTHSDEKLWAVVAFMKKLPEMSTEEYNAYDANEHMDEGEEEYSHGEREHSH